MSKVEKLLFDCVNEKYGNAEYQNGIIYFSDEDTGNGYKIIICTGL